MLAIWLASVAEVLSDMDDQGVELVEERWLGRQVALNKCANLLIRFSPTREIVPLQNSSGVSVDHEDWVLASIEKNGIRCFRTNAVDIH